jgi:hypothetical protein
MMIRSSTKKPKLMGLTWGWDHLISISLLLIWALTITLVNPSGDFPLNDDWVYGLVVRNILETGHFRFISPASANLLTQAYWGALFCLPSGFSFVALRLSTIVIAAIGITSLYALIREMGCPRTIAGLASLQLIFNPFYLGLANTFMTDVPFTSVLITCFYCYTVALKNDSCGYLIAALVLSFLALGIRQYALIFMAALCFGFFFKNGASLRSLSLAIGTMASAIGLQLTYQFWLHNSGQITGSDPIANSYVTGIRKLLSMKSAETLFVILMYVGAFTLPTLLIYATRQFSRQRLKYAYHSTLIAGLATLFGVYILRKYQLPRIENVLTHLGLGPFTLRDHYLLNLNHPVVSPYVFKIWNLLSICGYAGFLILCLLLAKAIVVSVKQYTLLVPTSHQQLSPQPTSKARSSGPNPSGLNHQPWLTVAVTTSIIGYTAFICIGQIFDRYILPIFPLTLILACGMMYRDPQEKAIVSPANPNREPAYVRYLALGLIGFYAYFSIASTHDYLAWNRARWQALNELVLSKKISPKLIDGGYEFNGWYLSDRNYKIKPDKSYWWVDQDDYIVASGPLKGYEEMSRYPFDRWLPNEEKPIVILRKRT